MSVSVVIGLAIVAVWLGWLFIARGGYLLIRLLTKAPSGNRASLPKDSAIALFAGAVLTLGGGWVQRAGGVEKPGVQIPLTWFSLPFTVWLAALSAIAVLVRLAQSFTALSKKEQKDRLISSGLWLAFGALCTYYSPIGKPEGSTEMQFFRGAIPTNISALVGLAALLAATVIVMSLLEGATRTRKVTRTFFVQLTLLAGSLLFAVPFAWLIVTSVKEDKDIASAEGLSWTPYVSQTAPYFDPRDPLFETKYQGQTVQVSILESKPSGALVEVFKPASIRGITFDVQRAALKEIPKDAPIVDGQLDGTRIRGIVTEEMDDGSRRVQVTSPANLKGKEFVALGADVTEVRKVGPRWKNYSDALDFLPPETQKGFVFLRNTLFLVVMNIIGNVFSCTLVAYAFARMRFPNKEVLFAILLSTMMLPAAVTMLPRFLIFKNLGWIDTLQPLWVPSFFAAAFNVFLLRQFLMSIPMELEDASKIDGCSYFQTLVKVMVPQIKPALAAISIFTAMGAWNDFMGPLIYINSPELMPISYAVQLFQGERGGEYGLMMAFATMSVLPVVALFFLAQKYLIEGVTLSGLGGR